MRLENCRFTPFAASLLGLTPAPAFAAGLSVDAPDGTAALVAAAAVFGAALWVWRDRRRLTRELARQHRRAAHVEALVAAGGDAFLAWDGAGRPVVAGALDGWPEAGDIVDADPGLFQAVNALRGRGEPFQRTLESDDGARVLDVTGRLAAKQAAGQEKLTQEELTHIVVFRDATAQRRAEQAQRDKRRAIARDCQHLQEILDATPQPIWRRDDTMRLTWVNRAYADAVEADVQTVLRDQIELAPNAPERPRTAPAAGEIRQELHYIVIAGQRRAVELIDVPDANGGGLCGFAVDVTAREEARAEVLRHADAHAETLDKLSTAVAIFGPDKMLDYHNSAFSRLWRLSDDWLAEKPHHGDVLEAMRDQRRLPEKVDFQAWKRSQLAAYTDLVEGAQELWHLPDGSTLRVVSEPHPFGGLLMFFEDVTDRLTLERSYNTLIAVQRETLNNLWEGVALFGVDGALQLFNAAYGTIWQLEESYLEASPQFTEIANHCRALCLDEDIWSEVQGMVLGHAAERAPRTGRLERTDGRSVDYACVPLPDGATLFTYLDITDSLHIERALRERNEALEAADQLKSEFIANVSYELRTPLNTIIGFSEILEQEYFGTLNERQHGYIAGTLEASRHLLTLINDVLDMATIEAGGLTLELSDFDIYAALSSVLGMCRESIHQHSLVLDCAAGIGRMEGDERRLKQALYNLLSNAIKFTPPGGKVVLAARRVGDRVEFSVTDDGVGIAPDDQPAVFDKFWKGDGGHHGMGIGLALVRSFIELHGGVVDLRSEPGVGTTVVCALPAKGVPAKGVRAPARAIS
jgi:signal transduction histidine kinase